MLRKQKRCWHSQGGHGLPIVQQTPSNWLPRSGFPGNPGGPHLLAGHRQRQVVSSRKLVHRPLHCAPVARPIHAHCRQGRGRQQRQVGSRSQCCSGRWHCWPSAGLRSAQCCRLAATVRPPQRIIPHTAVHTARHTAVHTARHTAAHSRDQSCLESTTAGESAVR